MEKKPKGFISDEEVSRLEKPAGFISDEEVALLEKKEPGEAKHPILDLQETEPRGKRYLRKGLEEAPSIGSAIGSFYGGPVGTLAGGGVGGAVKNIGTGLLDQGSNYFKKPVTEEGVKNLGWDVAGGVGTGVEQEVGGRVLHGLIKLPGQIVTGAKKAAGAITGAAERLGFKATPGMLSNSPIVQGLESSLEQSPSISGAMIRNKINPAREGLLNASEKVLSDAEGTKYSSGVEAAKGIMGKFGEKANNIKMAYEPFNEEMPKMLPQLEDKFKLADMVAKSTKGNLSINTNLEGFGEKVSNKILDAKSLADIEGIRKEVSGSLTAAYRSGDSNAIKSLEGIQDTLNDFRDEQFVKISKEAYPAGGKKVGTQMAKEYENAKSMFSKAAEELRDIGPSLGIKAKNPKAFVEAVSDMPPEELAKKIFKPNNLEHIQKMQKYFPEETEAVRKLKIQEIYNKSLNADTGKISPQKLLSNVNKMEPEYRKILFGDKEAILKDIELISQNSPGLIGPSGTPKGELYNQSWSPLLQAKEAGRHALYKGLNSPMTQNFVKKLDQFAQSKYAKPALGLGTDLAGQGLLGLKRKLLGETDGR